MKIVLHDVLYFVAIGLLIFGDGSRDTAIVGLLIADSIMHLGDVLSTIAIGLSKEGIKIRRVRRKTVQELVEEPEKEGENNGEGQD